MLRYALIRDGVVENICLWDGNLDTWAPPEGETAVVATEDAQPGGTYDGTSFSPPPVPVPEIVSPRQIKLALLGAGLLDDVEAFVAAQDKSVQISWEYATEWNRTDPLLNQMAVAFGMTDAQVDDLFRTAVTL